MSPVGITRSDRDIAFTLEVKSPKIFENIFLNNGVLVLLGAKGRVNVTKGGDQFHERTHLGKNSNVGHRSKFAQIPTDFQNNFKTAKYGQATASGAVPLNMVERDQNMGKQEISSQADSMVEELMNTFPNDVASAILKVSPTGADPISLIAELPATAFGSQTRTTGNIVRSDFPGPDRTAAWQTQFSSDAVDLSGATGIGVATKFLLTCSEGSALNMQPDVILTTDGVFSKASAAADVLRRFGVNDTLVKFKFDNIKIGNAALITDRTMTDDNAKKGLFLNTNFLRVQVLGGPGLKRPMKNVKVIGDGKVDVPLNVSQPIEADDYLNITIKAWLTYNLTFGALKYHGLMNNMTEV